MSASAVEVLDRAMSLRERRLRHASETVKAALEAASQSGDESWVPFAERIVEAGDREDWRQVFRLVMQGYRRVLIERDPNTKDIRIPQTQEEWDQLPDVLPEFKRRYRMAR